MDINAMLISYAVIYVIACGTLAILFLIGLFKIWRNNRRDNAKLTKIVRMLKQNDKVMQDYLVDSYAAALREKMKK
jgi:hypothetical protein